MRKLQRLILATPGIFLCHDAEEIITIERWLAANRSELERRAGRLALLRQLLERHTVNTRQFSLAVLFILLILLAVTLPAARDPKPGRRMDLFLACFAMLYLHAFVHVGQAALLRRYTPGVVTAVLVLLPFGAHLSRVLKREGLFSTAKGLAYYGKIGMAGLVPLVLTSLAAGVRADKLLEF